MEFFPCAEGKSVRQLAMMVALLHYTEGIHFLNGTSQHSYNRWQGISTKLVETPFKLDINVIFPSFVFFFYEMAQNVYLDFN